MASFCPKCGRDQYVCQSCGRFRCSKEQPGTWIDGLGNVCQECQAHYPDLASVDFSSIPVTPEQVRVAEERMTVPKIRWTSICRTCKDTRTGVCQQGMEPIRYHCGREAKLTTQSL